jgi:hypothetical protein
MTRLRTHNLRAKRRERKERLGFMLPSRWRMYGEQRRPVFIGMDLGREPAVVVFGAPRFGKTFELLRQRFAEGRLILHPVSNADLLEELRARPRRTHCAT